MMAIPTHSVVCAIPGVSASTNLTGDPFITDVEQGAWEEANFQPNSSIGGTNYGWRVIEGSLGDQVRTRLVDRWLSRHRFRAE